MPLALRPGVQVVTTATGGHEVVLGRESCALPGTPAVRSAGGMLLIINSRTLNAAASLKISG